MEFTKDIKFNVEPHINQDITITYNGFLRDSNEVSIVFGFGENWENTTELKMSKKNNEFSANIKMLDFDTFNFCFKNSNNVWDNNSSCNYISPILPAEKVNTPKFDIDALIEEILQPLTIEKNTKKAEKNTPIQIISQPIDLGLQISNILSKIEPSINTENLQEFETLDEILSGTVISEASVELSDCNFIDDTDIIEEVSKKINIEENNIIEPIQEIEKNVEKEITNNFDEELSLITIKNNNFSVSPRKLSQFYLFKKRIKLAFYKLFNELPKMIFGTEK